MPHEFNNIMVVTEDELVPHFYKLKTLQQIIHRYADKPYGITRIQRGGNGRQMLIAYDSLPKEIQEALGDPRRLAHILEKFYRIDGEAVIFFRDYRFPDGSALDIKYQERYIINASMLKALFALKSAREMERLTKGGSKKGILSTLCADAISFNKNLKAKSNVEHSLPANERRFKDCLNEFNLFGYTSLISRKHKNDNSRKVTEPVLALLNNMFGKDTAKPTSIEIHRRFNAFVNGYVQVVNDATGEIYSPKEFKTLSAATVTNYLLNWQNAIGTFAARSGDRQTYMQKFKPYHSLKQPTLAGSIISIDDRQPPFKSTDGKRVWFYNGLDLASEAFTCWVYGPTKEGLIEDFYRQLIRNYAEWGMNLPAELEAEMSLNSSFTETFLKPGRMFQHVRIEANNARGKRIERYFRELRYSIEKKRVGWLARPFANSESNLAGPKAVPELPYEDIINNGLEDIETWNNMPHSKSPELSRWQYFLQNQNPTLHPTNYQGILPYIGYKTITSCHAGIIRFRNTEYVLAEKGKIALAKRLIALMQQVEGNDIEIYWLDNNDGSILKALIFMDGQYICEVIEKPVYNRAKVEQTPADAAAREAMSSYVATIQAYGKNQYAELEAVTIINTEPIKEKSFLIPRPRNTNKLSPSWSQEGDNGGNGEVIRVEERPVSQPVYKSLKDRF